MTGSWCWKGGGAACALQDVCTPTGCSGDDNDNSDDDVGEDDDNGDDGDDDDDDDNDGAGQVEVSVDVQQLWTWGRISLPASSPGKIYLREVSGKYRYLWKLKA